MSKSLYVCILASQKNGTLYIGVASDLKRRVHEHKNNLIEGFTKKYRVHKLMYFEKLDDVYQALLRGKRLKRWNRTWKIKLIEDNNPKWDDL